MMKSLFAAAAVAAILVPAGAASVTVSAMTPTLGGDVALKRTVLNYDDLNPADAKGAAALYERITQTAARICASNPGGKGSLLANKVEECRVKAVKAVVRDIDSAELSRIAEGK